MDADADSHSKRDGNVDVDTRCTSLPDHFTISSSHERHPHPTSTNLHEIARNSARIASSASNPDCIVHRANSDPTV